MTLIANDQLYDVYTYLPDTYPELDVGYIKGEYVYVYRGDKELHSNKPTGLYKINNSFIFHLNEKDKNRFHLSKVVELNVDRIYEDVQKNTEKFIDPEETQAINNNKEIFEPKINSDDDVWKYIIKKVILEKKISLKNYKHMFDSPHQLNNLRSALERSTKMSGKYFQSWCEILGIEWELIVRDDGEPKLSPLVDDISVTSRDRW